MLDLAKATEILETYFANATSEQFAADIQKFCPELFEEATQAHQLIQLDPDVLQWFQSQGGEYKSLINSVLRRHIEQDETRSAS
jgi:uncharacterized protein (DUF4415 family)